MSSIESLNLRFPCRYIALARGFESGKHHGIDMGQHSSQGGKYIPVYAPAAGEVVAVVDGKDNCYPDGSSSDYGNYVKIKHADDVYTLCAHLKKGSILVKKGDTVEKWQQVANMGNTGYSSGNHVHFEVFYGGSSNSFKVDPLKYVYAYTEDGDVVGATTAKTYPIQYYVAPEPEPEPAPEEKLLYVYTLEAGDDFWNLKRIGQAKPGDTITIPE